jgi:hypothetical protein
VKVERWLFYMRLMLVGAVVAGGVAGAQDLKPYEGFKGVRWGASVDEMLKVFTNAYEKNRDIGRPRERTYFVGSNIGTAHIDLSLIFLDDKFECAQMSFNPNEFREIVDVFTERYGKPGVNEASVVGWSVMGRSLFYVAAQRRLVPVTIPSI